jgi:hypothetical protein
MYYIIILDMFRAIICSSAGGQNCIVTADCSPLSTGALYGRLQWVTMPDAVTIQFWPPEDEHSIARNMSRIIMWYIYYRIKELCTKLVIETSFYYDARSEKHQKTHIPCLWKWKYGGRSLRLNKYITTFCVGTDNFVNLHEDFSHFQLGQPFYLGLKTQTIN